MSRPIALSPAALICAALAAPLLLAAPARAQDEAALMADYFSGTWEVDVLAAQWSAKYFLAPDHSFRETGSDGEVHGTWALKDGKVCITTDHLVAEDRLKTYCNPGVGKRVGDKWSAADPVTGNAVFFTLKAGR